MLNVCRADWDQVFFRWNFTLISVHQFALHKDNRVIIAYGSFQKAFGVIRCVWNNYLQSGSIGKPVFKILRVLRTEHSGIACWASKNNGYIKLPTRHREHLSCRVDDLVNGNEREIKRHELNDGTNAIHGSAHAHASKSQFRNRSVNYTVGPKLFKHPLTHFVSTIVLGYFFPHQ